MLLINLKRTYQKLSSTSVIAVDISAVSLVYAAYGTCFHRVMERDVVASMEK